jgi:hypothetical protein
MGWVEDAERTYALGREVVRESFDLAQRDDHARWLREDLEEALLDLKEAVIADDEFGGYEFTREVRGFVNELLRMLLEDDHA